MPIHEEQLSSKPLIPPPIRLRRVPELYGTVTKIRGSSITLRTRAGRVVIVDGAPAMREHNHGQFFVGSAIGIDGSWGPGGVMRASAIFRAKNSPALWPDDR